MSTREKLLATLMMAWSIVVVPPAQALELLVPDFRVDQDPGTGGARYPSVVVDANDVFFVVWTDGRRLSSSDIYARRYDTLGNPLGNDFRVDQKPDPGSSNRAGVAAGANGNFIIAWSDTRLDGGGNIFARRYDANGTPLGNEYRVDQNSFNFSSQRVAVAVDANNHFIITWDTHFIEEIQDSDIFARHYDADGNPLGNEFRVDQDPGSTDASNPALAVDPNGNFIIVWDDARNGFLDFDIYARRYNSSGSPLGADFRVDQASGSAASSRPAIATDVNSNFVVAWEDWRDGAAEIFSRRYDANGIPLGDDFRVDQDPGSGGAKNPSLATDTRGTLTVCWETTQNGNTDIYARRYDALSNPLGDQFRVDQEPGAAAAETPSLALDSLHRALLVWSDQRNGNWDIYANLWGGEDAVYDSGYQVPRCSTGSSPCVVPASLINSRGIIGTLNGNPADDEPNQPNTLNTSPCTDGTQGLYHDDPSLDSFRLTDYSGPSFQPGDYVILEATVWCSSDMDTLQVFLADSAETPVWTSMGSDSCWMSGSPEILTVDFLLGNAVYRFNTWWTL